MTTRTKREAKYRVTRAYAAGGQLTGDMRLAFKIARALLLVLTTRELKRLRRP